MGIACRDQLLAELNVLGVGERQSALFDEIYETDPRGLRLITTQRSDAPGIRLRTAR